MSFITRIGFCVFVLLVCGSTCLAQYQPKDMKSWDYWFAVDHETKTYHAFYLQFPLKDRRNQHWYQWVGHAVSKDLKTWKTVEDAIKPIPGTFNDKGIATGSVARGDDGKWYMWFTCNGTSKSGIALAVSDDLITWKQIPDSLMERGKLDTFQAEWQGKLYDGKMLADPYIHPEKIKGLYWMTINSHILNPPDKMNTGAVVMMKSKDLRKWEPHKFVAFPGKDGFFIRCETTQTWEHNGKWYLFFGGTPDAWGNYIYISDSFDGPYERRPWSRMKLPDGKKFYIGKHIKAFDGKEYFLAGMNYLSLSKPYPITYGKDGEVLLSK